jgi:hypothetical protein
MPDKKPIDLLKERYGPPSRELLDFTRETARVQSAILKALAGGGLTVPQLAEATQLPADRIFWHVNALKKYGKVKAGDKEEGYFCYSLAGADKK